MLLYLVGIITAQPIKREYKTLQIGALHNSTLD